MHDGRGDIYVYKYNAEGRIVASMFPMGARGADIPYTHPVMADRLKWLHPQIRQPIRWEYFWYGELDMQVRTVPRLYGLAPGVVALTGLSGRGVPTGSMLGGILSEWAMGVPEKDLSLRVEPLAAAPFYMDYAPKLRLRYFRYAEHARARGARAPSCRPRLRGSPMTARTVLISGGGRGIGAATGRVMMQAGWNVSLGMRSPTLPDWAAEGPGQVQACAYEATDPAAAERWAAEARARFGGIDAVVANAGIMIRKDVIAAEDEELARLMEVHVAAPRRLAKAAWNDLAASGRGRVIIVSSLSGKRVKSAISSLYSVSKFAATGLAHALRRTGFELRNPRDGSVPGLRRHRHGTAAHHSHGRGTDRPGRYRPRHPLPDRAAEHVERRRIRGQLDA